MSGGRSPGDRQARPIRLPVCFAVAQLPAARAPALMGLRAPTSPENLWRGLDTNHGVSGAVPVVTPKASGHSLTCAPQPEDEDDEEPALEELEQREVLVLGLDGSGKSTFLRVLSGKPPLEGHVPTWGFNSVRLPTKDFEVDLLEIGGSQNLRFYWKEFVNEVDVLVFVVDSADRLRLPWARQELHKLLDKDPDLPVVVVANKQDLSEAMSMAELQQELGLQAVDNQREVFLLAASIAPAGAGFADPGTVHIWRLLLELLS
ncbi:ADP-ribosylation factor-like protein 10 [Pteropus vampyrus]|uniref:ADP-ribosylation factor-like protein 10 n=1 Tax=Pteropus vampyrus TaxID=132908 RepID=A0A6P6CNK4_PTEVA|nr:ADP-ribosylation factor-like protein 10 [Pteropus vampyrus]